ncbi:MAG: hypothetical protein GY940_32385 [bacterium]|nr:hypothetical protein [bacterium]
MKRKMISMMLILLMLTAFSLSAKSLEQGTKLFSLEALIVNEQALGLFGVNYEYFLLKNVSISAGVVSPPIFILFSIGSADLTLHLRPPKLKRLEFMIGGGVSTFVLYPVLAVPKVFAGIRYFVSPNTGVFVKAQKYYIDEDDFPRTALIMGITREIK